MKIITILRYCICNGKRCQDKNGLDQPTLWALVTCEIFCCRQTLFALESDVLSVITCCVRALSLDIGEKRIGIAISDSLQSIAQPLKLYRRGSLAQDIAEVKKLIQEHDVSRIVCGLPKNLDGSIGKKAEEIVEFAKKLEENTNVPVALWDERFSTDEAHRIFDMHDYKHKKRKPYIDMMAAQIILQGFLDAHKKG